jgi:hypothetical protein
MKMLTEIASELVAMFVGDARLAIGILAIVGGAAFLADAAGIDRLVVGGLLLCGCLFLLIDSVRRAAALARRA